MGYVILLFWIIVLIADFIMSIKLRKVQNEYNRLLEEQNKKVLEQNLLLLEILTPEDVKGAAK